MEFLTSFDTDIWQVAPIQQLKNTAIASLEQGQLLFFPKLRFDLTTDEQCLLSPDYTDKKTKNISFNHLDNQLRGVVGLTENKQHLLKSMMQRFSDQAHYFVETMFPQYKDTLIHARTSFRPVQVQGRILSYRKDDSRLHVDAFPANPNQGKRILRLFSNINPHGQDRVWRLGEPFEKVMAHFLPRLRQAVPGVARILKTVGITKSYRTQYDHLMLQLHDHMKADEVYQQQARQIELRLPPQSSWIVQTDHVSHAAMSGQYVLEQTFYLPVSAMQDEQHSPLRMLERVLGKRLV